MYIFIKNMVCVRCKMAVRTVLETLEIPYENIEMGRVTVYSELSPQKRAELNSALKYYELELMNDSKSVLVERIKVAIIDMFHLPDGEMRLKFSVWLSNTLHYDYTYLANIFSEMEKSTIERFYIVSKIERVKELIKYEGMSVKEISYKLNYSSVSHLCKQFKMVSGITPATFKKEWEMGQRVL